MRGIPCITTGCCVVYVSKAAIQNCDEKELNITNSIRNKGGGNLKYFYFYKIRTVEKYLPISSSNCSKNIWLFA